MAQTREKEIFLNPYVIQMDKFANSLKKLSKTFLQLEHCRGTFQDEEIENMFLKVTGKVCANCDRRYECLAEQQKQTFGMFYELLCVIEEYGAEINIEAKRNLQKVCSRAPRFLRETLDIFQSAKQILVWNNKIVQNREGYAGQLEHFVQMLQTTTRELDAGIFEDEHLEKKIKNRLKKIGVKMLSSVFYVTRDGRYEIHLTVKTVKGQCVATKELAGEVGKCVGRIMQPEQGERPIIGEEYCTIACIEGAKYYVIQGVAKIGKGCEQVSGDTFLFADLPGGKKGMAISDGMGSGRQAFAESERVVEMLEELLEAGFPVKTAIQMMNTALVIGRDEVRFSTIDVSVFDMYSGKCEIIKAGAADTFIKRNKTVEVIRTTTLPIGVLQDIEIDVFEKQLESGDFIVMMTDGVMDALPVGKQEEIIAEILGNTQIQNPRELAHHLLGKVLEITGEVPTDDMTIVAAGVWKR